ncbi:hypothetical protein FACS1894190_00970 [Spirochaetia bacterium]|nr:hypothetical protein FACS1894190_00970 [Spirochaetia bacterium]GHV22844.1 hypothetical protein FACS189494_10210 [Spirochaetia bacterium]
MAYRPVTVDRTRLTIMGVVFPDIETLDSTADALGSNMFEGFEPTEKSVSIIRDYVCNKITFQQLAQLTKEKAYA